jgi:hypothetical protein
VRVLSALSALSLFAASGCGRPALDPAEPVRGETHRLIHEPRARLWPAVLAALDDEGLRVVRRDDAQGALETAPQRQTGYDVPKRLAEIADVSHARGAGLGRASEFTVAYRVFLVPAGETDTSVKITSEIEAIDRSRSVWVLPGVFQIVPQRIDVPSRGVVERDLLRRLAAGLFTAEEMLSVLGEPGFD